MGLNLVRLKGEMFYKGLTEKDFDDKIVERINSETMPLSMLTVVAEKLDTTTEYLMGYGDTERRNNLHKGLGLKSDIIKKRLSDLGWTTGMAQHLVSNKENQLRYTGIKDTAYLGYELSNLCWVLDCSLDYLTGASNKLGKCPEKLLTLPNSTFKLDSDSLKDVCETKYGKDYVRVFAKKARISLKYARFLLEGNPFVQEKVIVKIAHKMQFESHEVFRYDYTETDEHEDTQEKKESLKPLNIHEIRHKRPHNVEGYEGVDESHIGVPELILSEGMSAQSTEFNNCARVVKSTKGNGYATKKIPYNPESFNIGPAVTDTVTEIEGKYDVALNLVQIALENPRMMKLINRLNSLDKDYSDSVMDILENAVSVFEKRMIEDGRGN